MSRFVDLDSFDLIEILRQYCSFSDCCDIEDEIEKKVVDAQPVIYAKTIPEGEELKRCSHCGHTMPYDVMGCVVFWPCNYCPHCGARMDGGQK